MHETQRESAPPCITSAVSSAVPDGWKVRADSPGAGSSALSQARVHRGDWLGSSTDAGVRWLVFEGPGCEGYLSRTKRRVYVDTSVIGGYFDDEFSAMSELLFERCREGALTIVISTVVTDELTKAPRHVRRLVDELPRTHVETLPMLDQAPGLANRYIEGRAFGRAMWLDAMHIATATLARVDVLVSWNFKHMLRQWRIDIVNGVNEELGLHAIKIWAPGDWLKR